MYDSLMALRYAFRKPTLRYDYEFSVFVYIYYLQLLRLIDVDINYIYTFNIIMLRFEIGIIVINTYYNNVRFIKYIQRRGIGATKHRIAKIRCSSSESWFEECVPKWR